MGTVTDTFRPPISQVDQERSDLCAEWRAFQKFRDEIRIAKPDRTADSDRSATSDELREEYRKKVMEPLNYQTVYNETLTESLTQEFSPSAAEAHLSSYQFTQRRKRDLLVATTRAIERRKQFHAELDGA